LANSLKSRVEALEWEMKEIKEALKKIRDILNEVSVM